MAGLRPKTVWFLAYTALFAVLAGFVFWGTWGVDWAPVMPDHPFMWAADWPVRIARYCVSWLGHGKFEALDFFELAGSPWWWIEFKYALCLYLSGLGMAWFLRGRGLSIPAAYAGGILLPFCGYWCTLFSAGHYGWFQWMAYGVFAFGLADRAAAGGKLHHWLFLGATLAWGSMHQPDMWLLFTFFTFLYFVFAWIREGRKVEVKFWCAGLIAFVLIGAPSFISAIANDLEGRDSQIAESGQDRWTFVTNWSMPPEDIAEFAVARVHGDTSCPYTLYFAKQAGKDTRAYTGRLGRMMMPDGREAPRGNYRQHSLYLGLATCVLALAGLVLCRRDRTVRFFAAAAFVFCLFSLGRYCAPVYRLVYALPMGDYLRAPVKWHHLTELCAVTLAAYGVNALARRGRAFAIGALALVVLGAADLARVDAKFCAPRPIARERFLAAKNPEWNEVPPAAARPLAVALGSVSLIATLGVLGYGTLLVARRGRA